MLRMTIRIKYSFCPTTTRTRSIAFLSLKHW